jgi:predicted MPP superfamily phosphohydrolase
MNVALLWILFGIAGTAATGGAHYYLYRRLVKDPDLPPPWRRIVTATLWVLWIGLGTSFVTSRFLPPALTRFYVFPFYIWIGCLVMLISLLAVIDLVRSMIWAGSRFMKKPVETDPGRRKFLARAVAGVTAGTVFPAAAFGMRHALGELVVRRIAVKLERLPSALDGFTIAQITDLHIGATRTGEWMAEVVSRVNRLKPDLIAVTGDLVDGSVANLRSETASIKNLRAPHGVFFVTGNHEYYSGAVEWCAEMKRLGLKVLRNEHVEIRRGGESFILAGVDDYRAEGKAPRHKHDVARAVRGCDPKKELVLLAHQPKSIFDAAKHGVGLLICGHTHGGQMWPIVHFSGLVNHYLKGLHKHGPTWIYVSSGTGFWGPPIRLFSTAEITLLTLKATAKPSDRSG